MLEIKERTLSLRELAGGVILPNPVLSREFCFFQLRMICECIALSCLMAHDNLQEIQSKKFQEEYSADALMKKLSDLHEDFYPIPFKLEYPKKGWVHLAVSNDDCLTKSDLIKLVRLCGSKVHRGSMRHYTFKPTENQLREDFRKVTSSANKIIRLLERHRINLSTGHQHIICCLSDQNGNPIVYFSETPQLESNSPQL